MDLKFSLVGVMLLLLLVFPVCAAEDTNSSFDAIESPEEVSSVDTVNTWYVNGSLTDGGDGSEDTPFNNLKSSIDTSKDGDTIYIASGTYNGSGKNVNLTIDKKLNLINWGSGDVIFDGEDNTRIFDISVSSFNITGLTFIRGNSSDNGGSICFSNGLSNSIINASFNDCHALNGGALYFGDSVSNNTFTGSFSRNHAVADGGVMYINASLINNIFQLSCRDNNASGNGGVIYINGNSSRNTFSGEYRRNAGLGRYAGVVYIEGISSHDTFSGNFVANQAYLWGGVVCFVNNTSNGVFSGNFTENYSPQGSCACFAFLYNVSNSVFSGNFSNNRVYEFNPCVFAVYGLFYNNTVNGYFANNHEGALEFSKCVNNTFNATFINNSGRHSGSINMESSFNDVFLGIFINNTAISSNSGGIMIGYNVSNTIINATFVNNSGNKGGAIEIFPANTNYVIDNLTIRSVFINNSGKKGGAIYIEDSTTSITIDSDFEGNYALNGGALYLNCENITIAGSKFINNAANESGGAIYLVYSSDVIIAECDFIKNNATTGGALFSFVDINMSNSSFIDNFAADGSNNTFYIAALSVNAPNAIYGDAVNIVVNAKCGNALLNGTVCLKINNKEYNATIENGRAVIQLPNLNAGTYTVAVTYYGGVNYTNPVETISFSVSKKPVSISAANKAYVITYGSKYTVTVKGVAGEKVTFTLNGKYVGYAVTNSKGVATFKLTAKMLKAAKAGKKNLIIKLTSNNYNAANKKVKITIKKEKTKITAKSKKFKKSKKTKKYYMVLKNSKSKAIKKVTVYLKVKGKIYKAKTNSKGKAVFKIKKLTKKGKFTAKIVFKGNSYYQKVTKKVKIKII